MVSFQDALRGQLRGQLCLWLATQENLYRIGSRLVPLLEVGSELYGAGFRFFCNREPPPYTPPAPPFLGGQCPTYYALTIYTDRVTKPGGVTESVTDSKSSVFGPISSVAWEDFPSENALKLVIRASYIPGSSDGTAVISTLNKNFYSSATVTSVTVVRQDGQPDNCGNVPVDPTPPPPTSSTGNTTVTYTDDDNNSVDVDVNFVFGFAYVDANLNINIPIRVAFNNTFSPSFNANANLSTGDITFNFGNTNIVHPPDGTTTAPDSYGTDGDTPAQPPDVPGDPIIPNPDTPEDETTRVIQGVIVTATTINENISEIFQDDNPNIYIPRLGNVQFLIQVGNRIAWTTDIPIRNRRHFIPCPWEGGAIDVKATPVPNVEISLTKVYKRSQEAVVYVT